MEKPAAASEHTKGKSFLGRHYRRVLFVLAALIGIGAFFFIFPGRKERIGTPSVAEKKADTVPVRPSVTTSVDSPVAVTPRKERPIVRAAPVRDSAAVAVPADTSEPPADTVPAAVVVDSCKDDTIPLWAFPEPSGGLQYGPVKVWFHANKSCSLWVRFEGDSAWRYWHDDSVPVKRTATLEFRAKDRCNREMEVRKEYYEIADAAEAAVCPAGMDFVKVGGDRFCIDRYEWPNRKGVLPTSFVSLYQATDSCFAAGKRLCTAQEWSLACSGPYDWKYPYGRLYERYACGTHDTTVRTAGSRPECRAFFGMYDMSGNLLEWTSTKADEDPAFFKVMGGFWQSGPRSGCFDMRYSYFPQNRHNPVGFRCCKNIASVR